MTFGYHVPWIEIIFATGDKNRVNNDVSFPFSPSLSSCYFNITSCFSSHYYRLTVPLSLPLPSLTRNHVKSPNDRLTPTIPPSLSILLLSDRYRALGPNTPTRTMSLHTSLRSWKPHPIEKSYLAPAPIGQISCGIVVRRKQRATSHKPWS